MNVHLQLPAHNVQSQHVFRIEHRISSPIPLAPYKNRSACRRGIWLTDEGPRSNLVQPTPEIKFWKGSRGDAFAPQLREVDAAK